MSRHTSARLVGGPLATLETRIDVRLAGAPYSRSPLSIPPGATEILDMPPVPDRLDALLPISADATQDFFFRPFCALVSPCSLRTLFTVRAARSSASPLDTVGETC